MHDHDWIIEVCNDLKDYARKHHLNHLVPGLDNALNAARHDVLLQSSRSAHEPIRDCAILGGSIGLCQHSREGTDDAEKGFTARHQW